MAQALAVMHALCRVHPDRRFRVELVRTRGDRDASTSLAAMGAPGVFTRELELALIEGRIDLAVHSLKDLPTALPDGLALAPAVPRREDPRDVVVTRDGRAMALLPAAARVGTGSLRRRAQLAALRGDLVFEDMRGNVDTRLRKVRDGQVDAVVLARAGLARLGLLTDAMEVLDADRMLPAPGQGALGLEIREADVALAELLAVLDDPPSRYAVVAERALLRHLEGGCRTPVAALGLPLAPDRLTLTGLVASADGARVVRDDLAGPLAEAEALGRRLADRLLDAGGREILAEIRRGRVFP